MNKILRSKTGKYHQGRNSAANCNGRSGKFSISTKSQAECAQAGSLCKKCFPCGIDFEIEQGHIEAQD